MFRCKGSDPVARIHVYGDGSHAAGWDAFYWERGQDNEPRIPLRLRRDRFVYPKLVDGKPVIQANGLPQFEWAPPPVLQQSQDGSEYVSGEYVVIFAYDRSQVAGVRTPAAWCRCNDLEKLFRKGDEPDWAIVKRVRHLMDVSELGITQEFRDAA